MIKIIILSTILYSEPAIISKPDITIEANRRRGKGSKGRRKGGYGLR